MIGAKVLAVGPGKSFSVCIGQADFEKDLAVQREGAKRTTEVL
jgi:hypothetical protein